MEIRIISFCSLSVWQWQHQTRSPILREEGLYKHRVQTESWSIDSTNLLYCQSTSRWRLWVVEYLLFSFHITSLSVLYHIFQGNSRSFRILASKSRQRRVYHQCEALHIINTKCCISSSRRRMHAGAWWDTAPKGLMICTTASWWYAKPTGTPKARTLASGNPYCGLDKQKQNICR